MFQPYDHRVLLTPQTFPGNGAARAAALSQFGFGPPSAFALRRRPSEFGRYKKRVIRSSTVCANWGSRGWSLLAAYTCCQR
jgi:hypothetical protein